MFQLPTVPLTQALSSATFSAPPLDGSLTLPEIFDWHVQHSPEHPLFVYARQNGELQTITWAHAGRAILTGSRLVRRTLGRHAGMASTPVVGILAASETISYSTLEMAIMRAGYTVFPISVRNSPAAVAHLINKVGVKHLFIGREQAIIDLKDKALKLLSENPDHSVPKFSPIPIFEDLYVPSRGDDDGDLSFEKKSFEDIAMYLHSSGSTSFPKPIAWTHHHLLQFSIYPYFGERDLTGVNICSNAVPMYHTMGNFQLFWTASTGVVINTYEPKSPPTIPTAQNALEGAMACHSELVLSVPSIIEEWSRTPEYVKWLSTTSGVLYGGGPLAKSAGDYLASQGVQIINLYGLTETGALTSILPAKSDNTEWDLYCFPKVLNIEMVPHGDGLYECVVVTNTVCRPSVINTQIKGVDAYATSDLFIAHPEKPGCWTIYGRTDDQIMHSTGEKTNPGPLEHIINQDPHVKSSIIFGRGQLHAGVIVDLRPGFEIDPEDKSQLEEFRDKIWPTVQRMNEFAPQHSRLFREMITVAKASKPFQYTAKATPRRQLIIKTYDEEIKALYSAADESSQTSVPPPKAWNDEEAVLDFVRMVASKVLPQSVQDTDDIFQHGCDSLQATWIRNTIVKALRASTSVDTQLISGNVIYDYPTLASLASFLTKVAAGSVRVSGIDVAGRAAAMRAMVEKYTVTEYPIHSRSVEAVTNNQPTSGDVVLVTGTTGGLGCYLLAELIANPDISRVYAVNRGKDATSLRERQRKALVQRGVEADKLLASEKLVLLAADTSSPHLGLSDDEYEQVRSSVTHIIHNAWPVDFNLSLASFEPSIRGLRNLIELSLTSSHPSPPTLVFASTIGMLQGVHCERNSSIPEKPIEAEQAVGNGYTEGKWVSEEIMRYASSHSTMNTVVVRVGQLSGGSNGSWNVAEWLPSLVQSAQTLGCLPTDERSVDWFPVHIAAKVMIDYRLVSGTGALGSSSLVHLVHPKPSSWASLASVAAQELSVPLVSYVEWLGRLEKAATSDQAADNGESDNGVEILRKIPALRLLPFYRSISSTQETDGSAFGFSPLACEEAVRLSKTMSDGILSLGERDIRSWIQFWRQVGYIRS